MKTTTWKLELLDMADCEEDADDWYVKYSIMLVQCEDTYNGTMTSWKRIGVLTETDDNMTLTWDCGKNEGYPGCLFDATISIQNYIEMLTNPNL